MTLSAPSPDGKQAQPCWFCTVTDASEMIALAMLDRSCPARLANTVEQLSTAKGVVRAGKNCQVSQVGREPGIPVLLELERSLGKHPRRHAKDALIARRCLGALDDQAITDQRVTVMDTAVRETPMRRASSALVRGPFSANSWITASRLSLSACRRAA